MSAYDELAELEPVLTATGRPDPFDRPDGGRTRSDLFACASARQLR